MAKFPNYRQTDAMSCGPSCLRIISAYYGKKYKLENLVRISHTTREGSSFLGLSEAAQKIGFKSVGVKLSFEKLAEETALPCIAHWNQNHFIVVYKVKNNTVYVSDPAHGLLSFTREEFMKSWCSDDDPEGLLLLLEPSDDFYENPLKEADESNDRKFSFLFNYLKPHKRAIVKLILSLIAGSLLQLIFPFLTQSIVDVGINSGDLSFIYIILLAQLMVFFGRTTLDIIRNYILVHVSSRINISLVNDFFAKLMRLPISYFDTKMTGDIMQRIHDNSRIEQFLTGSSITTLFSVLNFLIFSGILAWYSLEVFAVFMIGTVCYFLWITFFMKRRAALDYKRFNQGSENQSKIIELISGMQEIKLHNAQGQKREQLDKLQVKLFNINLKGLSITTAQNSGSAIINELKNIIITFLAARLVLQGEVTLGMMLSISYITGQLNAPVILMVNFIQSWQDARLSLERLNEIHHKQDEEDEAPGATEKPTPNASFEIKELCFKYPGSGQSLVIDHLSVQIPAHKVTAIVGGSGSGKTTLMKLLLRFYDADSGEINLKNATDCIPLHKTDLEYWRSKCGVVMQEGFIFNDSIANNIAVGVDKIDEQRLRHAIEVANISSFISSLPLGHKTKIGMEGVGVSTGQKQRILIARAVYKNPDYLFFDEATSALDANNERIIINNLDAFFKNKTVVIVAHRLSTVKNADQIIVLDQGNIVEVGDHATLTAQKGAYYELVKNQLELGN